MPNENCPGLIASRPPFRPLVQRVALKHDEARFTYVGHSTFLIESPQLVRIATDYNDYVQAADAARHRDDEPRALDALHRLIRTRRSSTCCAAGPATSKPARIDINFKDVRVRNVPTNIRDLRRRHRAARQFDLRLRDRESVHRASRPSASHADAAAAQRDRPRRCRAGAGRRQLHARSWRAWSRCCKALKAPLMIPMHYFSTLHARPLPRAHSAKIGTSRPATVPSVVVSKTTLPAETQAAGAAGPLSARAHLAVNCA